MSEITVPVRKFTPEEMEPFTSDYRATEVIANIFCRGSVQNEESDPDFGGWIVNGKRPLSLSFGFKGSCIDGILAYGGAGSVFPTYQMAIEACVRTKRYADENGYKWFHERCYPEDKLRIFSVRKVMPGRME